MANEFWCIEMRNNQPWSYQIDSFAVCACAHFMLYAGNYIEVESVGGRWKAQSNLKRYWAEELWTEVFDILLNVPHDGPQPNLFALGKRMLVTIIGPSS